MDIIAAVLVLLYTVYVVKFWIPRANNRLQINQLLEPDAIPILDRTYKFFTTQRNRTIKVLQDIARSCWLVIRTWVGPNVEVYLIKPQHFEAVMNSTKQLEKSYFYKFLNPWLGTGLITSAGHKWHTHRKMITPAFQSSILESFLEVFSEKCDILIDKLGQEVDCSGFDIFPYISRCSLDIICETAMGVPIHAQEDAGSEYVRAVSDIMDITVYRCKRIWLHPDFIFYNTSSGRRYKECLNTLHGFTQKVILERRTTLLDATKFNHESFDENRSFGIPKRKAFLDLLLEISRNDIKLPDEEIREEVDTFIFAGHDTTAASTSWALFMLGHHPEIQERVYAELSDIFQGSQRHPTMADLHEMKYLDRVIKETMRVYPTVPLMQRVLSEDMRIDGYDIPAGTTVTMLIYVANRNPEYFPNPEEFDPDNFLPEYVQKRHPFAFVPFSAGPRKCIGHTFAVLEEKILLSSVLRKYKIRSMEKRKDITSTSVIVLRPEHGIKVALTLRT